MLILLFAQAYNSVPKNDNLRATFHNGACRVVELWLHAHIHFLLMWIRWGKFLNFIELLHYRIQSSRRFVIYPTLLAVEATQSLGGSNQFEYFERACREAGGKQLINKIFFHHLHLANDDQQNAFEKYRQAMVEVVTNNNAFIAMDDVAHTSDLFCGYFPHKSDGPEAILQNQVCIYFLNIMPSPQILLSYNLQ